MKRFISLLLSILLTLGALSGCSKDESFEAFTYSLFLDEITSNTITLHYGLENPKAYGIKDYKISLGDFSPEARSKSRADLLSTKLSLLSFPYYSLSTEDRLTYDVLNDYLDTQLALCEYDLYQEPLSFSGGIQINLPVLLAEYEFHSEQDVKDYLKLLTLSDEYIAQVIEFEKEKSEAGLFMSDEQCAAVVSSCESFLADTDKHYLATTFENRLKKLNLGARKTSTYIERNDTILEKEVFPAYKNMISSLMSLMGSGTNAGGICHFEQGAEYYELLVYSYTGCEDSIDEIYQRIASQRANDLLVCADLQVKDATIIEQCTFLEWEMEETADMISRLQTAILPAFPAPPDTDYKINYVDECMEDYMAPAFYIVAPIDNYKENVIYLNEKCITNDIYCFTTLAHEGYPGHLYQTVMSYEYGLPEIRSLLDFSGYVEGWATYVELLSYFYAGLDEDVAAMLAHNQAATLSLYATTDIGLHYYGWDREEVYEFWKSYGVMDTALLDDVIKLILSEPGNYLKYYVGYLEFLDLKNYAAEIFGENFQLVEFHRTILDIGPAPFSIIKKYLKSYYHKENS